MYVTDVTTFGGNSGGPLVLVEDGSVVGLHVAGGDGYGYALPIDHVREFLGAVR
jgi:S1-C subfamily serine protease